MEIPFVVLLVFNYIELQKRMNQQKALTMARSVKNIHGRCVLMAKGAKC